MTSRRSSSVLVTGAAGRVGQAFVPVLEARRWSVTACGSNSLDVTDRDAVLGAVTTLRPEVIVNLAACTDLERCERQPDTAFAANTLAVRHLAEAARRTGAHVCHLSTDYVFDGAKGEPYQEWDETHPQSVYAQSKLAGERELGPDATIVRTAWLLDEHAPNLVPSVIALARDPARTVAFDDTQRGSPTVVEQLVGVIAALAAERRPGLFHVTNQGDATWLDVARHVLLAAGGDPGRARPFAPDEERPRRLADRPPYSVLDNATLRLSGLTLLPDWHDGVTALVHRVV